MNRPKRRPTSLASLEVLEQRVLLSRVTFVAPVDYVTGKFPDFVTTADLNNDGKVDCLTADYGSSSISVLMGNGNGTFNAPVSYAVGNGPTSIAVADLNGDGKLDLVVSNSGGNGGDPNPDHNTVSVLFGNGDGTFQPAGDLPVGNLPTAVAIADVNGDGHPDIIVANRLDGAVGVLLGNGAGAFAAQVEYSTGFGPESMAVADLNNDGRPDIVTANRVNGIIDVLLNAGDGTFPHRTTYLLASNPRAVAIADMNGDGIPDIVTANPSGNVVSVLRGTGTGKFNENAAYTTGGFPFALAIADMNLDGRPDVITANQHSDSISVLLRNFDFTLRSNLDFKTGIVPTNVAIADVNGDGKPDIITADFNANDISVLINTLFPSSTQLIASQNPLPAGGRVQFTAIVTAAASIPRGNVQFFDGTTLLANVTLRSDGTATFNTSRLVEGDHSITARYLGGLLSTTQDVALAGSVSTPLVMTLAAPVSMQPLLAPILNSLNLRQFFKTGDIGSVQVTINNQGGLVASGVVGLQLFASIDQTISLDDVPLATAVPLKIRLGPHASKQISLKFTVTSALAPGAYFILATLAPGAGITPDVISSVAGFTALPFQAG